MTELSKLDEELTKAVKAKESDLLKKIDDQVEAAAKAVAGEKKLTAVFTKQAIIYGGVDVTDDLLAKLNGPTRPRLPRRLRRDSRYTAGDSPMTSAGIGSGSRGGTRW